jgi:hypothetical protein
LTEKTAVPDWVQEEMKYIEFGEKRLEKRLLKIISDFSQNPTASIPEFCGDWAATTKPPMPFSKIQPAGLSLLYWPKVELPAPGSKVWRGY